MAKQQKTEPDLSSVAASQRILAVIAAIKPGQTASYSEVARRADMPRRARMVAKILATNEDPDLPWYRVIRADGRIAFPLGSAAYQRQRERLEKEGHRISNGRVMSAGKKSAKTLDQMIWGEE